jgi:hypothetical protein
MLCADALWRNHRPLEIMMSLLPVLRTSSEGHAKSGLVVTVALMSQQECVIFAVADVKTKMVQSILLLGNP